MRSLPRVVLFAGLLATSTLRADVTVRYKNDLKFAPALPAVAPAASIPSSLVPQITVMRLKGTKTYANIGTFASIIDVGSGQITLIDPDHKKFATAPFQEYQQQVEAALSSTPALSPEAQKATAAMKTSVAMRKTGRTDTIQGIQAEETELTVTVDMALPEAAQAPGPFMKLTMQFWSAKQEETLRVPAIRELAGYSAYGDAVMNPFEMMQKTLSHMPGMNEDFFAKLQELTKNSPLMLKSHVSVFMPIMAVLAQQMERQGRSLPEGFDPNEPWMELSTEIQEFSTDAIEDSVFEVPADFEAASFQELMNSITAPQAFYGHPRN